MPKRRRPRKQADPDQASPQPARHRRRKKRMGWRLALLVVVLLGVVAALPTIVGSTPARDTLLGWSLPDTGWAITSQGASFSWIGTQTIQDIRLTDPEGKEFFTCKTVTLDRSLLSLLIDGDSLGRVLIQQPEMNLVTRSEGSNLEDLLSEVSQQQQAPQEESSADSAAVSLELELIDGKIHGRDDETGQNWLLSNAGIEAKIADLSAGGITARCQGKLTSGADQPEGGFELRVEQAGEQQFKVKLLSEQLPLILLKPWLAGQLPDAKLQGEVSTDAECLLVFDQQGTLRLQSTGRLEAKGISVQPSIRESDRLQFAALNLPWDVNLTGKQLQINRLSLESDWAQLAANGSVSLDQFASVSLEKLPQASGSISGVVQLNRLADMMPNTLHLRDDVQIKSGELEFRMDAKPGTDGIKWVSSAIVSQVAGTDGRRNIRWEEPIEAKLSVNDSQHGLEVGKLTLISPFAELGFQPEGANVNGDFRFDLQRLGDELGRFVDLDGWSFQGRGEGTLAYKPAEDGRFQASTEVRFTELNIAQRKKLVWAEPKLQIEASATGSLTKFSPDKIATAELRLRGARDRLDAELLQPVSLRDASQPWKVTLEATGPLASWAGRLRPWVESVPEQLEGEARLQATALASAQSIQVLDSSGSVANLHLRQGTKVIDEPQVEFAGDFRWDPSTSSIASSNATFQSSTVTFGSQGVLVQLAGDVVPKAQGNVAFRANLERLALATGFKGNGNDTWPRGLAAGTLQLNSNGSRLIAKLNADVEKLEILRQDATQPRRKQPQIAWSEPKLNSEGKLVYDVNDDRLTLEKLTVVGNTLRLDASSGIEQVSTQGKLQASGTLQYDSEELARLLATYLGPEVQLKGDRVVRFQLAGRLHGDEALAANWSNKWSASAEAGWTGGNVFGLAVGNGRLAGALTNGQLQIAPVDVVVGEGRITARPVATLSPGSEQIVLPRGPLISNVAISPEVSDAMLKYVAPVVAGATRTEGRFSLQLEEAKVPLQSPKQSRALGKLDIHRLQVTPGPLIRDIAAIVGKLEAIAEKRNFLRAATRANDLKLLSMSDQQIEFQIVNGRVYHRNLKFSIEDVPVTSSGSVGFDQTLEIDFEVPIQQKWLGDKPAFQSLAGQTLRIPVRGTFNKTKIDSRGVTDLTQKLIQGAANQVLGDELNRAFDKLFK